MAAGTVRIVQRRSANGSSPAQRATLRSLGLRGIGKSVEKPDGSALQGMIRVVSHLVEVEEVAGRASESKARKAADETKDEQDG